MYLSGKVALVTGGSRGIGKDICIALAEAGSKVCLTYLNQKKQADEVVASIEQKGGKAIAIQMDVRERITVRDTFSKCVETFGGLNVLVNNAGINNPTDFDQLTDHDWDEILDVNLKGPFICSQLALPHLQRSGGGSIINIGSVVDSMAGRGQLIMQRAKQV